MLVGVRVRVGLCGYCCPTALDVQQGMIFSCLHLTEAGLLSMPVMSARVESAIISLLALESHSNVSSWS
jgi:hypothetical protein